MSSLRPKTLYLMTYIRYYNAHFKTEISFRVLRVRSLYLQEAHMENGMSHAHGESE